MKVKISPSKVQGSIIIPPSKSMAHRAIIAASLANGKSTITNVAYSDDIKTTIAGMKQLGANITCLADSVIIEGIQDFTHLQQEQVFCKESGSTLRFFIPIFSLCDKTITFTGENRLLKRPQKIYEDLFAAQNIPYIHDEEKIQIGGSLQGGTYELDGSVSSQFISGLLFALPLLKTDSTLHIKEPYESRSYVDLTLQILKRYGIHAEYRDANTLFIPGKQQYKAHDYHIEGDYSQLAFFAVLAAINNDLDCLGVAHDSLQGDKKILTILKQAGASITPIKNGYHIAKADLSSTKIDLQDCPDLGPILTIMAMYAKGETHIYNAQRLRYKESDRIQAMEDELHKCNVSMRTSEGDMYIEGASLYTCQETLYGHKDHRIVMSLSIAATVFDKPIIIDNAEAINKSYPTFFDDLRRIGGKVEILND